MSLIAPEGRFYVSPGQSIATPWVTDDDQKLSPNGAALIPIAIGPPRWGLMVVFYESQGCCLYTSRRSRSLAEGLVSP